MQGNYAPSHMRTSNIAIATPTSPNTTVVAFVICPNVLFPFAVFDPPVPVPELPPLVRLAEEPNDVVGILEIVDHVLPEEGRLGQS